MNKISKLAPATLLLLAGVAHGSSYSTVNGYPQFSVDEGRFGFYWAVWRGLSEGERDALRYTEGGFILSKRSIAWTVYTCDGSVKVNEDAEVFFYLDEIKFDADGAVIPIGEAPRADFRYMNMVTLNSQHLRGIGPFEYPKRVPGETSTEYAGRKVRAYEDWQRRATPVGTYGSTRIEATHRLYPSTTPLDATDFLDLDAYRLPDAPFYERFLKYAPSRWPVYYDERAHKPHHLDMPLAWEQVPVSEDQLKMRFEWNWCQPTVAAKAFVPRNGLPPAGPNRPGRPDNGNSTIEVIFE